MMTWQDYMQQAIDDGMFEAMERLDQFLKKHPDLSQLHNGEKRVLTGLITHLRQWYTPDEIDWLIVFLKGIPQ